MCVCIEKGPCPPLLVSMCVCIGKGPCLPLLMSMCVGIGKGPCPPLLVSMCVCIGMCVLCIPSLSGKAYSHPCVYCISPLLQKAPRSVSLLVSMCVYIPPPAGRTQYWYLCECVYVFLILFSFLSFCRTEGRLVSLPCEFRKQRESVLQSSQAKSEKCLDRDAGEGTLIQ